MSEERSHLDVDVAGTDDGPDLVLLHGGSGSREDLAALRARLGPARRVIAPDLPGHGRSPDPEHLSYAAMAQAIADLLDEFGVRGADLVGWSDGGIVGLFLARDRPELVGRIVAISANVSSAAPAPDALDPGSRARMAGATVDDMPLAAVRVRLPGAIEAWPVNLERLKSMWLGEVGITLADLASIRTPILYLTGDRDLVRAEHTLAMFRATPGASLAIVPDVGHDLVATRVDDVARIVARFVGRSPDVRELRVAMTVDDYPAALAFYRDVLGLAEVGAWSTPGGNVTILEAGQATLELLDAAQATTVDDIEVGRRVAGPIRLAFEVEDSVATSNRLVAAGASPVGGPVDTPWRDRNVRVQAPDGMQLTLFSVLGG